MFVLKFLETMKNIQNHFLDFVNDDDEIEEKYQNFVKIIKDEKIQNNPDLLKSLLYLISKVSKNINRTPNFYNQIQKTLLFLKESIKQTFSNFEIFNIFKRNKLVLLFLFEEKIISMDHCIYSRLSDDYLLYFTTEVDLYNPDKNGKIFQSDIFEQFEEKRRIGENHHYICELIRKDAIGDFITYVDKENIPLNSRVNGSIYETNSFLLERHVSLIEYCAFFGSFQIFNYLYKNGVIIKPKLILFAIHGANPEIINVFQQLKIEISEDLYKECLHEAIKCHHNTFADYISSNFLEDLSGKSYLIFKSSLKYYNFYFIQKESISKSVVYDLCENDYVSLVKYFLKTSKIEVNNRIILEKNIL